MALSEKFSISDSMADLRAWNKNHGVFQAVVSLPLVCEVTRRYTDKVLARLHAFF
jgi:hypothetical protein